MLYTCIASKLGGRWYSRSVIQMKRYLWGTEFVESWFDLQLHLWNSHLYCLLQMQLLFNLATTSAWVPLSNKRGRKVLPSSSVHTFVNNSTSSSCLLPPMFPCSMLSEWRAKVNGSVYYLISTLQFERWYRSIIHIEKEAYFKLL
jgi:hypothetical protein